MRKITDAALLALALTAVSLSGWSFLHGRDRSPPRRQPSIALLEAQLLGKTLVPLVATSRQSSHQSRSFDPTGSPSLLLVLSTTCSACARTVPAWRLLLASMPKEFRTVAISREPTALVGDWLSGNNLNVDVVHGDVTPSEWGVQATPTTLLLDGSGRVFLARVGMLEMEVVAGLVGAVRTEVHSQQKGQFR